MKLWNKIKREFNKKSYYGLFQSRLLRDDLNWNKTDFLNVNELSLYVNKGIKKRAEKVAQTEWFIQKDEEVIEDNEWLELINQPNEFLSGPEFWETYQRQKDITGSVFVWKEPGNGELPKALHLLQPDKVKIKVNNGEINEYEFTKPDGGTKKFPAEEIIYSFHPDPKNPLKGESIIKAGSKAVDTEIQIAEYQNSVLRNGGKVEGVFNFKTDRLTPEQVNELKAGYQEQYGEAKKSGLPLFLGSQAEYKAMGLTPEELNYLETKKMALNDIVIMTGVPKSILSSMEDVKFSNAKEGERAFMTHTIVPLINNLTKKLNQDLLPEDLTLDFIDPTPEDTDERLKILETAHNVGAMTVNELREELNLGPVDGGDVIMAPMNQMPLLRDNKSVKKKFYHPLRDPDFRKRYGKVRDLQSRLEEDLVAVEVKRFLEQQRERLIENLGEIGTPQLNEVFNREQEEKLTRQMIEPLLLNVVQRGGDSAMEFNRSFVKQDGDFFVDTAIRTWIASRSEVFARQATETTVNELSRIFQESFEAPNPRENLVAGIEESFLYSTSRAETIARTETHGAFQKANFEASRQADVPIKIWVTVGDGQVRDSHAMQDGMEIPREDYFPNGLLFAGDPQGPASEVVNCRCVS